MRLAALLVAAVLAVACGGGSGSSGQPFVLTSAGAQRTDVLFGYYGENAAAVTESSDHANLAFVADFYGPLEQMAALTQAKGLGMKAIVMVPAYSAPCVPTAPSNLDFWFQRLATAGLLWDGIVAVYPADEPACEPNMIRAVNAMVRESMAKFPAIAGAKLAVIYACKAGFPGADAYDIIGCDDYDSGSLVFQRYYAALAGANPSASLIDVMAGADPWRSEPQAMVDHANGTNKVWAVLGFIWQTADGHFGIRENGLRPVWCAAGRKFTRKAGACL